ncbi:MAG: hypothetical protein RL757_2038 [Bacteroidota bacterium]|jgi:hypothetical protein
MKATSILLATAVIALTSCQENKPSEIKNAAKEIDAAQKAQDMPEGIMEVRIRDNGAVVPDPNVRTFVIHPASKHFHFANEDRTGKVKDGKNNKGEIEFNLAQDTVMRKYVAVLAKVANNKVFLQTDKPACVGVNGLDFMLIKATKDTIRFSIPGGSRCDKSIFPEAFALQDLLEEAIKTGKIETDHHDGDHDHEHGKGEKGHEGHDHHDHEKHEKGHKH